MMRLTIIALCALCALAPAGAEIYVSAADSGFAGAMVVEVVVREANLGEVGVQVAEPGVTINGDDLRMVQGTDGAWYAYFANMDAAGAADRTVQKGGEGLDFGVFCGPDTDKTVLGVSFDARALALPRLGALEGAADGGADGACGGSPGNSELLNNVIRRAKAMNTNPNVPPGQIGLDESAWPIIQLYSFNDVTIKYDAPGAQKTINLEYGELGATYSLDRTNYPAGAEVFVTINDPQLNIDPTDEDSWTFGVETDAVFYMAFTDTGADAANGGPGLADISSSLGRLGYEDNGRFELESGGVLGIDYNGYQLRAASDGTSEYTDIVTFAETRPSSGEFRNYDTIPKSSIVTLDDAPRGTAGTIRYNDESRSVVTGPSGASFEPRKDVSYPGREIPVVINDADQNTNSGLRDSLDAARPDSIMPLIRTGDPLTLEGASNVTVYDGVWEGASSYITPDSSGRLVIKAEAPFSAFSFETGYDAADLRGRLDGEAGWLNYDLSSLGTGVSGGTATMEFDGERFALADLDSRRGLVQLDDSIYGMIASGAGRPLITIELTGISVTGELPVIVDFFTFGPSRIDALYRFELEETAPDSGTFEGTMEYVVAGFGIEPSLVSGLRTIDQNVRLLVAGDHTGEDALSVTYEDLGIAHTTRSKIGEARTHTGMVNTDAPSYGFGRPVTITLDDPDLNLDGDTIDVYTVINDPAIAGADTVGDGAGNILFEILIKEHRYERCTIEGVSYGGLAASGFTLRETGPATGLFEGTFKMPSQICNSDGTKLVSPAGGRISAKYYDRNDSAGGKSISTLTRPALSGGPDISPVLVKSPSEDASADVVISGLIEGHRRGTPASVIVRDPEGVSNTYGVSPSSSGNYRAIITIGYGAPTGVWSVDVLYSGRQAGGGIFTVTERPDMGRPEASTSQAPDAAQPPPEPAGTRPPEVRSEPPALNDTGLLPDAQIGARQPSSDDAARVPGWVEDAAEWWANGLIPDDDYTMMLEYLVKKGIIQA